MPELPEVETIRSDLEKKIIGKKVTDFILLWPKTLREIGLIAFKKKVIGQRVISVSRRGKIIIVQLESRDNVIFHMKMTGHLLIESSEFKVDENGKWLEEEGSLNDPYNQYIRAIFWLDDGNIIAFSDLRKFGYIKLLATDKLDEVLDNYGPEPFSNKFNSNYLLERFKNKSIAIKKALLDQTIIAGIGNIYADEILFMSKIHPETQAKSLKITDLEKIIDNTRTILDASIKLRGTSSSDYRDTDGKKGEYEKMLKVYRRTGQQCGSCNSDIKRIAVGGRGTHFCPKCQVKND
jgi:formamidopyrimidine-DNA glycosylase